MVENRPPFDEASEREDTNEPKEITVGLGEWFPLIDPANNRGRLEFGETFDGYMLETGVSLNTGIFDMPLEFSLSLYSDFDLPYPSTAMADIMNPFYPENGYRITDDDFDPEKRKAKVEQFSYQFSSTYNGVRQFFVSAYLMTRGDRVIDEITPEQNERFSKLALDLSFPNSRYRTHFRGADPEIMHNDNRFYTPAIPQFNFGLILPADVNKLSQVQARFAMTTPIRNTPLIVQ